MDLNQKRVEWLLWVENKVLPQMEEFKCLGVLLTNERKMGQEIGVSAEIRVLTQIWCDGKKSQKAQCSIYQSPYFSTLICGQEIWEVTKM